MKKRLEEVSHSNSPNSTPETSSKPETKPSCPECKSVLVKGHGKYRGRSRYKCLACFKTFNDLTKTPLAGIHDADKLRQFAAKMADGGESLRRSCENFDIDMGTAFNWRHKVLRGYSVEPSRTLKGIAEAEETFFLYSEKGNKTVSKRRRPRKRGGKAQKAVVNDERVPVIVGCDRQGDLILAEASASGEAIYPYVIKKDY